MGRNHSMESNGPDVKVRGSVHQIFEKYLALGRDAWSAGDRVAAEAYFQHADHYYRLAHAEGSQGQQQQGQGSNGYGRQFVHPSQFDGEGDDDDQPDEPQKGDPDAPVGGSAPPVAAN